MQNAASNPPSMPSIIDSRRGPPDTSSAPGCSSSAAMLRMNQWLSFTTTRVAPPANAPSTAALASPVMRRRERSYSAAWRGSEGSVWSSCTTPAMPSMSTEMKTCMLGVPQ